MAASWRCFGPMVWFLAWWAYGNPGRHSPAWGRGWKRESYWSDKLEPWHWTFHIAQWSAPILKCYSDQNTSIAELRTPALEHTEPSVNMYSEGICPSHGTERAGAEQWDVDLLRDSIAVWMLHCSYLCCCSQHQPCPWVVLSLWQVWTLHLYPNHLRVR